MIIAMTGKKGSGKSTVGDYIANQYGFKQYAFAAPMKLTAHHTFGWTDRHLYGDLKEQVDPLWGISPRQFLQWYGTDAMQHGLSAAFPDFAMTTGRYLWVRRFALSVYDPAIDWVITDLRFPHEYEGLCLTDAKVIVVRVDRPGCEGDAHESERQIDEVHPDYIIDNDADIGWLWWQVEQVMDDVGADAVPDAREA